MFNYTALNKLLHSGKRSAIESRLPPFLQRLGVKPENWIDSVSHFQKCFFDAAGTLSFLEGFRERRNMQRSEQGSNAESVGWIKGKGASKKLYAQVFLLPLSFSAKGCLLVARANLAC